MLTAGFTYVEMSKEKLKMHYVIKIDLYTFVTNYTHIQHLVVELTFLCMLVHKQ